MTTLELDMRLRELHGKLSKTQHYWPRKVAEANREFKIETSEIQALREEHNNLRKMICEVYGITAFEIDFAPDNSRMPRRLTPCQIAQQRQKESPFKKQERAHIRQIKSIERMLKSKVEESEAKIEVLNKRLIEEQFKFSRLRDELKHEKEITSDLIRKEELQNKYLLKRNEELNDKLSTLKDCENYINGGISNEGILQVIKRLDTKIEEKLLELSQFKAEQDANDREHVLDNEETKLLNRQLVDVEGDKKEEEIEKDKSEHQKTEDKLSANVTLSEDLSEDEKSSQATVLREKTLQLEAEGKRLLDEISEETFHRARAFAECEDSVEMLRAKLSAKQMDIRKLQDEIANEKEKQDKSQYSVYYENISREKDNKALTDEIKALTKRVSIDPCMMSSVKTMDVKRLELGNIETTLMEMLLK